MQALENFSQFETKSKNESILEKPSLTMDYGQELNLLELLLLMQITHGISCLSELTNVYHADIFYLYITKM